MAITLPFATFSRHEDGEWSETTIGTPQWAVVSPLLANLLPTPRFRSMDRGTRGLRLRGSAARLAMYRRDSVLPSPSDDRVGDLSSWFSKLNTLPVAVPVYASDRTSRCAPQDPGSGWIRCSFPVGLFHSLLHAGLSRRTFCPTRHQIPPFGNFSRRGGVYSFARRTFS